MDIELEHALSGASSRRQKLPRIASNASLISDGDSSETAEENGIESSKSFTVDEEKVIVRKLDSHLVLFIAFLYMLSFLDRSSKSNRRPINGSECFVHWPMN